MVAYLSRAGALLWLALVLLEPDVGFQAPAGWRALFWALQVGLGLVTLEACLLLLTRRLGARPWPVWLLVPLSAVLGSLLLAPAYWLLGEGWMVRALGFPVSPDDDPDLVPAAAGWAAVWLQEFGDIVGPVTACWCLLCLPRLNRVVPPLLATPPRVPVGPAAGEPAPPPPDMAPAGSWQDRLPEALGRDVIAVASELQYLRVWTPRGVAMVLGSLNEVEAGGGGCRIHRSWWVADAHVVQLQRRGDRLVCLATGGLELPVSRRRRADVVARYGDSARYGPP